MSADTFDAEAKEAALRAESESWDTSEPIDAVDGDIPVIDISGYLAGTESIDAAAAQLALACEAVGFWQLVGHGIDPATIDDTFAAIRKFHALPLEVKEQIRMDRPDWPLGGVGYLPVGNRKLPRRATGNENEAVIIKGDRDLSSDGNQWLADEQIPGFRATIESFSDQLEALALKLLPLYATALGLESHWFNDAFEHPYWRLRMTHYPASSSTLPVENRGNQHGHSASSAPPTTTTSTLPVENRGNQHGHSASSAPPTNTTSTPPVEGFGIAPHVDTTFFTLLLQDSPGLTIYHTPKARWINVPLVPNAFVVNSGELLRQWTNDRYLSVRHFANANGAESRYSIPFFVNATRDHIMECIPTCCDDNNPAKYPPISYNESQGVIQGE